MRSVIPPAIAPACDTVRARIKSIGAIIPCGRVDRDRPRDSEALSLKGLLGLKLVYAYGYSVWAYRVFRRRGRERKNELMNFAAGIWNSPTALPYFVCGLLFVLGAMI